MPEKLVSETPATGGLKLAKRPVVDKKITAASKPAVTNALDQVDPALIRLVKDSITDLGDENGWAFLGELGNLMLKKKPDFDSRNYGFPKLLPLVKSMHQFEFDERETGKNNIKHIYIRNQH